MSIGSAPRALDDHAAPSRAGVELRPPEPSDVGAAACVLYEAFRESHDYHRFAGAYTSLDQTVELMGELIGHPRFWGVVAVADGRVVGSAFLDERGEIGGVGPVSVDPAAQSRGVGRSMMAALLERAAGARGVRLLQDSFNGASLALYTSLGFEARGLVLLLSGRPRAAPSPGVEVRPLEAPDLQECAALCVSVHGHERTRELCDAMNARTGGPIVAVREGRICAYATTLTSFAAAHAVAASEADMRALIVGGPQSTASARSFLMPAAQSGLLRFCLTQGMRIIKPLTYMTLGDYTEPRGPWIPSVEY